MSNSLTNAERFLNAYAQIEHELQRILNLKEYRRFYNMLERASKVNPLISQHKFDLRKYSDLRNAIVHERADGKIIAEPNDDTVNDIERIARLLLKPPLVTPLFQKDVVVVQVDALLSAAIKAMSRHRYSQVPVIEDKSVAGLLTSNMVIRWMGMHLEKGDINLRETRVRELLPYSGAKDNYMIVPASATLSDVLELFLRYRESSEKLESVLITRHGRPEEHIMGIITNLDLPLIQKELE